MEKWNPSNYNNRLIFDMVLQIDGCFSNWNEMEFLFALKIPVLIHTFELILALLTTIHSIIQIHTNFCIKSSFIKLKSDELKKINLFIF